MKKIFLALFFAARLTSLFSQPDFDEGQYSGCHIFKRDLLQNLQVGMPENALDHNARSDTFDVKNYDIRLDVTNFSGQTIYGTTTILVEAKMNGLTEINFDLEALIIDSVKTPNGGLLTYLYQSPWLKVILPTTMNINDQTQIAITYHGKPKTCSCGFGGFYFEGGNAYNLGIGLTEIPPNNGRTWFPCFDSFRERATYDLHIKSNGGRRAYCSGDFQNEQLLGGDTILRNYRMNLQLPTYLLGVAVGNYAVVKDSYSGSYGPRPIELVAHPADTTKMKGSFSKIKEAIKAFEAWYGPYVWGRVGYVGTMKGAMEHSNNIATPDFTFDGTQANAGLFAHELAHHWWGNIAGPSLPIDMWIKEGGAEYGSHLFTEQAYGKTAFETKLRDNTKFVIKNAHKDDGGYLALSPMPQPQTYGTHTYNKGAMVYHNLRGYLGDTLYRHAMTALLDSFHFHELSAQQFRDFLTGYTGKDMNPFFEGWIFNAGYPTFEIDSVKPTAGGVQVFIQQKLHHANSFFGKVPLQLTFWNNQWQRHETTIEADGEYSNVFVPLADTFIIQHAQLNENQRLNYATFTNFQKIKAPTASLTNQPHVDFQLRILAVPSGDSAFLTLEHFYAAADPQPNAPADFHISKNHWWRVGGIWPEGFKAMGNLSYNSSASNVLLDADLVGTNEDSIGLVWRPRPGVAWQKFPYFTKNVVGSNTNGSGFIRIDSLWQGDYAFANGELMTIAAHEPNKAIDLFKIYPNPAHDLLTIESLVDGKQAVCVSIFDNLGKLIRTQNTDERCSNLLKINDLPSGIYQLKIMDKQGNVLQTESLIKQ